MKQDIGLYVFLEDFALTIFYINNITTKSID